MKLILLFLLMSVVHANTEAIKFKFQKTIVDDSTMPMAILHGNGSYGEGIDRLRDTVTPLGNYDISSQHYKVAGELDENYEVRICWPALYPSRFKLSYNESNGVLTVNYAIDYYSHLQHLMDKPHAVPYEIIINKLELLVIPTDFMQTLQIVSLGLFGAYFIRDLPYKLGFL